MPTEYVLWGLPKGSDDRLDEQVLATDTVLGARIEKIKALAGSEGWHGFRIQTLDLSAPPDFTKVFTRRR